jgi:hypothetical protein
VSDNADIAKLSQCTCHRVIVRRRGRIVKAAISRLALRDAKNDQPKKEPWT